MLTYCRRVRGRTTGHVMAEAVAGAAARPAARACHVVRQAAMRRKDTTARMLCENMQGHARGA